MADDKDPRSLFEDFRIEIDPERIDEAVRTLTERMRALVEQGRYTKVRLKYKGKPLMPDLPLPLLAAAEVASFWSVGLMRALVMNLGLKTFLEVEFIHDAHEKVAQGQELFAAGEVEEAEARYREALRMKPGDPSAHYHLGVLLRVTGRKDEALASFEKVIASEHALADKAREAVESMSKAKKTL